MLTADPSAAAEYRRLRRSLPSEPPHETVERLRAMSAEIRLMVLDMIDRAGMGHIGGDFSVTDILATLFGAVVDVDPEHPDAPGRDRFILSKGHSAAALYATLAHCGYFPRSELAGFTTAASALNGHPDRRKVPGVETNTGPLGHGLPVAVGCALGARLRGDDSRTVVVLGDGELQEGSNWEAAMTAGHQELAGLYAVVDRNRLQQGARTEDTVGLAPLAEKWAAFRWEVRETDGHDHAALLAAFAPSTSGRPVAVIAHTVKGKGVSFIEDRAEWHHKVPDQDQVRAAVEELTR
ncbi:MULTISPECIES: transketolase [Streptomyces]|uniref:Transketolase n=1 Tax=Streptomyces caniscabiei TaxID=2746961 RepID=A0ABU4MZE8_9ACTN|nr:MULTISPECIES: transketolase [Streptomyces]MBE4740851.1 transketolase [Streptomyces caniscabiei]MBE4760595.1 transketolase [Streptomyces caniscabiei]MBE4774593.1 transketolase [Streptomyces caniscabiei]MBE4788986.1 transketolase [Streptomyces caniscabiei]MBE4798591.1 transketolase [Streptomyces caniscabiei]